jgi:late competence protein required for DNA uptake (superfamily II DNA/RNA helicase)
MAERDVNLDKKVVRGQKSIVWNHFSILTETEVQCHICQDKLSFHNSTSSMLEHLRRRHTWVIESKKTDTAVTQPSGQTRMTSFMSRQGTLTAAQSEQVDELICQMIVKDLRPISIVNGDGFTSLMASVMGKIKSRFDSIAI